MSTADDVRSLLLVLRLRGAADTDTISGVLATMRLAVADVGGLLARIEPAGLVEQGAASERWRLTPEGRAEGERLLAIELDEAGARGRVTEAYGRFLRVNGPLLRVCADWQLRDATPASIVVNDHTDAGYDQSVLDRLAVVHAAALPLCVQLEAALVRLRHYRERLSAAHERIASGDLDALDRSTGSYHHVWYELHEDLIATLGRDRSTEPLPDTSAWPP